MNELTQNHASGASEQLLFDANFIPDLGYLNLMADGDQIFVQEMIATFLDSAPVLIGKLEAGIEAHDLEMIRFGAHKLATHIHIMGIHPAIAAIDTIEKQYKNYDLIKPLVEQVILIVKMSFAYFRANFECANEAN